MISLLEIDYNEWDKHLQSEILRINNDLSADIIDTKTAIQHLNDLLLQLTTDIKLSNPDDLDKVKFISLELLIKIMIFELRTMS
jgi:hypothetical protein